MTSNSTVVSLRQLDEIDGSVLISNLTGLLVSAFWSEGFKAIRKPFDMPQASSQVVDKLELIVSG